LVRREPELAPTGGAFSNGKIQGVVKTLKKIAAG
jgi:hypothetical protein